MFLIIKLYTNFEISRILSISKYETQLGFLHASNTHNYKTGNQDDNTTILCQKNYKLPYLQAYITYFMTQYCAKILFIGNMST